MPKKKLIRALESDNFTIYSHEDGYLMYDNDKKGVTMNTAYVGFFKLTPDNKAYVFNGKEYSDKDSLLSAMNLYNELLPFNHEYYNPLFKKSYFVEMCVRDYITDIGFESGKSAMTQTYVLKDIYGKETCKLSYEVNDNETSGKVTRFISESSFIEIKFEDLEGAINACNSMIAPYLLAMDSKIVEVLSKMTDGRVNTEIKSISVDFNKFSLVVKDERKRLIELLEKELTKLKEI
jgi:hypothetical protein